jgi:aminomethyltransferase
VTPTGGLPEPATTSPLHGEHAALGATFIDFAGCFMPLRYGSDTAEHHAVRNAAGLFDLSHMGQLTVQGPSAAEALDFAMVSQPSAIGVGRARYSMICHEDGNVLDDLVIYRLAVDRFLVVANAANGDAVADALRARSERFAVDCSYDSEAAALIAVQGPRAVAILGRLADVDVSTLRYYTSEAAAVAGRPALIARTGYTGEDGFEIFCSSSDAATIWDRLRDVGTGVGLAPAGLAARDSLRLEAGMPLYGRELTREHTPYDAGLGRVVKLDKPGDFVGRGALEDRARRGVERNLVGLVAAGRQAPRSGYAVLDPRDGSIVGRVTSGMLSPTLGHPIAMAYVDARLSKPDTPLVVDIRGRHVASTVTALPFYRRGT